MWHKSSSLHTPNGVENIQLTYGQETKGHLQGLMDPRESTTRTDIRNLAGHPMALIMIQSTSLYIKLETSVTRPSGQGSGHQKGIGRNPLWGLNGGSTKNMST